MAMDQGRIQIELMGESFTVRGDSSRDDIMRTASYLNDQLNTMQMRYPSLSQKNLVLLCAFHLADELWRVKKDYEALVSILDS